MIAIRNASCLSTVASCADTLKLTHGESPSLTLKSFFSVIVLALCRARVNCLGASHRDGRVNKPGRLTGERVKATSVVAIVGWRSGDWALKDGGGSED